MNSSFDQINEVRKYDVIFIGQLASVCAHMFSRLTCDKYSCLILGVEKTVIEPSLLPFFTDSIRVSKPVRRCSLHYRECANIQQIRTISRQIQLNTIHDKTKTYEYSYLVYSGNYEDWLEWDSVKTLNEALKNEYSLVYSNYLKRDIEPIYQKYHQGNVLFYVPNGRHSGYDNFNMLLVKEKYEQILQDMKKKSHSLSSSYRANLRPLRFQVILQGTMFFPHCKEADQLFKSELIDNFIELVYNSKVTQINYLRRTVTLNQHLEMPYTVFYSYVPQKVPTLLSQSDIDPYNCNSKTLLNKTHKNIFVFGADILPTTHTLHAVQQQVHVICHNLGFLLERDLSSNKSSSKKLQPLSDHQIVHYNGQTSIRLHLKGKEIVEVKHLYRNSKTEAKYSSDQEGDSVEINNSCSRFNFYFEKYVRFYLTEAFYNYSLSGSPHHFFAPNLKSVHISHSDKLQNSQPLPQKRQIVKVPGINESADKTKKRGKQKIVYQNKHK